MPRLPKEINWDRVQQYIEAGCDGVQIAEKFHIQDDTFYRRFEKEYGCRFQDYKARGHTGGEADLRLMLHAKAIKGNVQALVFLARCRLGMKEPETVVNIAANQAHIDQSHLLMQQAHEIETLKALIESNGYKSQTEQELLRSDSPVQHMGGGSEFGENICEHRETD